MTIKKMLKKDEGFTLIELLIVIAIIAILAAIAIPQFSQYRARAFEAALDSDAKNLYTASQAWLSDNPAGNYTALIAQPAGGGVGAGGFNASPNVVIGGGPLTLNGAVGATPLTLVNANIQDVPADFVFNQRNVDSVGNITCTALEIACTN